MKTKFPKSPWHKSTLYLWLLLTFCADSFGNEFTHPNLWSFEKIDNTQWALSHGGSIATSPAHYKHGKTSLQWNWKGSPAALTLKHDIGFVPFDPAAEDKSIPTFAIWVYNEKAVDDYATFIFATDDIDDCSFTFNLNFTGWRAAWVAFERDMQGTPRTSMNNMRIEAPKSVEKGRLFIDHMLLCTPMDSRHHTPDRQVPFVNKNTTNSWLIQEHALHLQPDLPLPATLTEQHKKDIATIEKRFRKDILRQLSVSETTLNSIYKQVAKYKIKCKKGTITGVPVWFGRNAELYIPLDKYEIRSLFKEQGVDLRSYFGLMQRIATAYANTENRAFQEELEKMFMDMYYHMADQGVAFGSGLGTIHHYGYNWRSYYRALYLMRSVLEENGELQDAVASMQWFAAVGEVFPKPTINGMDMDAFNTQVMGRLSSILMMDDSPKKVQYLSCFSRWIDNGLLPAPGLNDAFKIDGSAYHHANHYPAYATGGMDGATRMVNFLSGTSFKVSEEAHRTLKKALLTMRFYCNKEQWPVSFSGRHPNGQGALKPEHFAIMAYAGTPDGKISFDKEMAAAYLRLAGHKKKDKNVKQFSTYNITPEATPHGHVAMPYACSSTHRRGEWSATVRGHSRYLWAAEHYIGANYYGRYLAHGSLQIMNGTNKESGYVQQGWDWNRFPGTTVINLPIDELKANILNVDQHSGYEEMLFSDEAFAGGLQSDGNGVFAFKLHEHDKYQGSLRARKSYFFMDEKILCLGTDIENTNSERPTETTLFQNHVESKDKAIKLNGEALNDNAFNKTLEAKDTWIMDNKGNAYFIPEGKIQLSKGVQHSKDQATMEATEGLFSAAVISHGTAPQKGTYHYLVMPYSTEDAAEKMAEKPGYSVLSQEREKHIVHFDNNTTTYAFFEPARANDKGIIVSTNISCIAMTELKAQKLTLDVCNPDLTLYKGEADEIYQNGKRVERSIYSRPWRPAPSLPTEVKLELKGKWQSRNAAVKTELLLNGNTLISITCKDGLSQRFEVFSY